MEYKTVYEEVFAKPAYSAEHHIQYDYAVNNVLNFNLENNSIIDIGSGRGHLINILNNSNLKNYTITSVDLKRFHNYNVDKFIDCDLSIQTDRDKLLTNTYDILICTDVLEHLDKSYIESVIEMFSKLSDRCILAIANHSDIWDNVELHTIQENNVWWDNVLTKYFNIIHYESKYDDKLYEYVCITK